jgi:scavenger receptor class B, member 1
VSLTLRNENVHVTKTAAELLFDGYEDSMVTLALENAHFLPADEIPPYDRVGFFYGQNNTANSSAYYNVDTGMDDIKKLGIIRSFNFQNQTEFFEGDCGVVNGSAGEFYPQKLTHQSTLSLFTPDLCRSIPFDFTEEVEIHGIKAYKYSGGDKAVDNGTQFPEMACYSPGEKLPVGVFNVSACRHGAPVFMSFPHFYKGDQFYVDQFEGLSPNKSKHEFFYVMEPVSG